jgi:hypothetical protein
MKSNGDESNHLVDSDDFLLHASELSLNAIWDNPDDDVYAELLTDNKTNATDVVLARLT